MMTIEERILEIDCLRELEEIMEACEDRKVQLGVQAMALGKLTDDCLCDACNLPQKPEAPVERDYAAEAKADWHRAMFGLPGI